jgi:tRNA pseudouridine55 synthase
VADAHTLSDPALIGSLVGSAEAATRMFPVVEMSADSTRDLMQGKRPATNLADSSGPLAAISPQGTLIGLVKVASGQLISLVNFPPDA